MLPQRSLFSEQRASAARATQRPMKDGLASKDTSVPSSGPIHHTPSGINPTANTPLDLNMGSDPLFRKVPISQLLGEPQALRNASKNPT